MGNTYCCNGDGVLVYPSYKVGYNGIAASLRLKALRDAIENYEYLVILDGLGLHSEAMDIVMPIANSFTSFETDPNAYEQARIALAELITRQGERLISSTKKRSFRSFR